MPETVGRGGSITLDVRYQDPTGLVDPTLPQVDVINPSSVVVVNDAVPTRVSLGIYSYTYAVPANAPLGIWSMRWTGVINTVPVGPVSESFTVVEAGTIEPIAPAPTYPTLAPIRPGQWFVGHAVSFRFTVPGASSSWSYRWSLRRAPDEAGSALISKTTGISSGENYVDVTLSVAESNALLPGAYHHSLERTGTGVETVLAYGWAMLQRAAA